MICQRCRKPLTRAYVQDGPFAWGPKCARTAGFTKPTGPRAPRPAEVSADPAQMPLALSEPQPARQGLRYQHHGADVIALESGHMPMVGVIADPWFSERRRVDAGDLVPAPSKYLQGAIPS